MKRLGYIIIMFFGFMFSGIVGLVAYRLGYCNAYDKCVGATECKPARKWMFRGL